MTNAAERILQEALRLDEEERVTVARKLLESLGRSTPTSAETKASWRSLREAAGAVALGGDAIEDTERLYDG